MDKPCDYLVIGANGLVGSAVTKALGSAGAGHWVGTAFRRSSGFLLMLDVTNKENLHSVLRAVKPKTVVFAANLAGGVKGIDDNVQLGHVGRVDPQQVLQRLAPAALVQVFRTGAICVCYAE